MFTCEISNDLHYLSTRIGGFYIEDCLTVRISGGLLTGDDGADLAGGKNYGGLFFHQIHLLLKMI